MNKATYKELVPDLIHETPEDEAQRIKEETHREEEIERDMPEVREQEKNNEW